MANYLFTRQFLDELSVFEKSVNARDLETLEQALPAIAQDPNLPRLYAELL